MSHCTGLDRTLPHTRYSSSSGNDSPHEYTVFQYVETVYIHLLLINCSVFKNILLKLARCPLKSNVYRKQLFGFAGWQPDTLASRSECTLRPKACDRGCLHVSHTKHTQFEVITNNIIYNKNIFLRFETNSMTYACVESEIKYLAINFVHVSPQIRRDSTRTVGDTHLDQ